MRIMKPSLSPALKPGPTPRLATKSALRAFQYTEEYDIAEPLIASILWGRSRERQQASVQLDSVNDQIQAKNIRYKIPKSNGCIDIAAFKTASEQLVQASITFAGSQDTTLFLRAKNDLDKCIRLCKLPKSWNIEWGEFLDFHRERVGRSNTQGNHHKKSRNAQRDLPNEAEDEYDDGDVQAGYHEESGVDDEEEEEQEETHNGYHGDENEYSDQEDEYDDDEEEEYDEYDDEENEHDQGEGDGYDEGEGEEDDEYDDAEDDELDQENPDHDSFYDGPELIYHTERELECVDIGLVRRRAQNHYGLLLTSGSILGWRKTKLAGLVAVMGYECQGKRTARVKRHNDPNDEQESVMKDRSSSKVLGIGLIAWEVDSKSVFEPTKSLFPTTNGTYPATFIAVRWEGDIWTWESREDFHSLMKDLSQFEVDILMYFMAISQEGDYLKAMTGKRPTFPGLGFDIAST
ncbi:hypothetical protein PENARI_c003G03280 [Penicillium arizonense]|uniref:Uncharacterized protein n=1 Tax=Penicillium arizonense TaxID=1835702 RepID=A0A1F5LSH7_PENAI|nr:hypothetical protein PENARI_c003G03280 [Penicillium arizonense]OGE56162.1 hypothetical protein PENARI_c003G03280 [Penicillium arizonense]